MGITEVGTPVTSAHRKHREFCNDDSSADSGGNFFRGLDSETNVAIAVTNNNNSLEPGPLTGTGLLLDRLDLC